MCFDLRCGLYACGKLYRSAWRNFIKGTAIDPANLPIADSPSTFQQPSNQTPFMFVEVTPADH